jgi:microsomal epoxide hydrolase/non-specific protein-tyrosine kinase
MVRAGEVDLAVYEAGPADARPPVLFVHGWPEIAYSWKSQLEAVAAAGRRAIALDLKGFGRSAAPPEVKAYGIRAVAADLVALFDALEIERAVLCGHDWGGLIVWPTTQLHPDRVAGVVGVCTPHLPNPGGPPIERLTKRFGPDHYIVQFQTEDAPEALFEADVERFFRIMFRGPVPRAVWPKITPRVFDLMSRVRSGPDPDPKDLIMSDTDLAVYVDAYRKSGFRGGVNLYRNMDANYAAMKGVDPVIRAPALWVGAELDLFLPTELAELMNSFVPDLEKRVIPGCGHWATWEKPAELNAILIDWLARRFP